MIEADEYEVALSFAGAQRGYVESVARALNSSGVRTFYDADDDEEVRLWGRNLAEEFHRIYSSATNVVVMFVSEEYAERSWTIHERRAAVSKAIETRREYILPARFDDIELPGIPSTLGYVSLLDVPPGALAEKIRRKLVSLGARIPSAGGATGEWLVEGKNASLGSTQITVVDQQGTGVPGAQIAFIRRNETATFSETDSDGHAVVSLPGRETITVWIAHPDHDAMVILDHDSADDIKVRLASLPGTSSLIFTSSTGYLPGVVGRLNPIADGDRFYFYGDNLAADGRAARPAHLDLGVPIAIEDSLGARRIITFVSIVGDKSLIRIQQ